MKTINMLMIAAFTILSVSVFAQDSTKHKIKKAKQTYVCPMHPDMVMSKPGKCPKCGTALGLSTKEQMKMEMMNLYVCPVHPDVTSHNPGNCPKCKSKMTMSSKEQMKADVMKTYACSMHPDVVSDKPGKCSKCGMDLVEVKTHKH